MRALLIFFVVISAISGYSRTFFGLFTPKLHGSFRTRFNSYFNVDLGKAGDSGWRAIQDSDTSTWGDLRLRLEPSVDLAGYATVHFRIDVFDNMIMGSTPINPFYPEVQAPLRFGFNSWRQAIRLKFAWIEVPIFSKILLLGGRMPDQFGLGILHNSGSKLDSDFGDAVDGVRVRLHIPGFTTLQVGLEFPYEGATSATPLRPLSPAYDLDQMDDITRWTFVFDTRPLMGEQEDDKKVDKKVIFSFYNAITTQDLSSERLNRIMPFACQGYAGSVVRDIPYDCITLSVRDAFFYTGSFYLKYLSNKGNTHVRVEAEFTGRIGKIKHVQSFTKEESKKTFLGFAGAIESEVRYKRHDTGLYLGAASGDDVPFFGVLDNFTFVGPDDRTYRVNPYFPHNDTVTSFLVNRDYRVDLLLFREVIGTITNSFYVKPYYSYRFLDKHGHVLDAGVWVLSALALNKDGTPGHSRYLGTEGGIEVSYSWKAVDARLEGSLLVPGEALKMGQGSMGIASAIRGILYVHF